MATMLDEICYHHFSLTFNKLEIGHRFQDVRFVLVAGCERRAEAQATFLANQMAQFKSIKLTLPTSRFALFKVGPTLVANHGMGPASMSIALHELLLMCQQAQVIGLITLVRFGTCGGIGVEPGTVCITSRALDSLLQDFVEMKICLKLVRRQCKIDMDTVSLFERLAKDFPNPKMLGNNYRVLSGPTVATNDFYEEQGRTNGAICEHSPEDKAKFLAAIREVGVINMEMESNYLAAMCNKLNVSFGVICVALNNRLVSDKVELSPEQMGLFEKRLFWLNYQLIRHKLTKTTTQSKLP